MGIDRCNSIINEEFLVSAFHIERADCVPALCSRANTCKKGRLEGERVRGYGLARAYRPSHSSEGLHLLELKTNAGPRAVRRQKPDGGDKTPAIRIGDSQ